MVPRWRSENFASFKTMVEETKQNADGATVLSMLTGDFLRWVVEHTTVEVKRVLQLVEKYRRFVMTNRSFLTFVHTNHFSAVRTCYRPSIAARV